MNTFRLLFFTLVGALVGSLVGLMTTLNVRTTTFKVGECVRELGHETVETIIYVTDGGAIETKFLDSYDPSRTEKQIYDNGNKLIKVNCK